MTLPRLTNPFQLRLASRRIGRDCFNPTECMAITRDMAERFQAQAQDMPHEGDQPVTQQRYDEIWKRLETALAVVEAAREMRDAYESFDAMRTALAVTTFDRALAKINGESGA